MLVKHMADFCSEQLILLLPETYCRELMNWRMMGLINVIHEVGAALVSSGISINSRFQYLFTLIIGFPDSG